MILEHFTPRPKTFRPTNIEQYTIFQIARRLNAGSGLKDYLVVAERYSSSKLIRAYRAAVPSAHKHKAFFDSLRH